MNNIAQAPGKLELLETSLTAAIAYGTEQAFIYGRQIRTEWPWFTIGYSAARGSTQRCGRMLRSEMPVVDEEDLPAFKEALSRVDPRRFCDECTIILADVLPMQKQIYVDKSVGSTIRAGRHETQEFIRSRHLVLSQDGLLVDGHHRWLSGMVCDPSMKVPAFKSRIPMSELFPLVMAFSESQGNQANG